MEEEDNMDIKLIVAQAEYAQSLSPYNWRLIDIYSGNLNKYVRASMAEELSPESFRIASKRVPSINVLERITKKLSKVYTDVPKRTCDPDDQPILDLYIETTEIQAIMTQAETLLNLNHNFALEPYFDGPEGQKVAKVRVLGAHEFTVYSDDLVNPNKPTAIIKFMGTDKKTIIDANKVELVKTVNVYWIYTKTSLIIVNSDGDIMPGGMDHNLGEIPIVYCSSDSFKLQPDPDMDAFDNTLLAPKSLADLNYAAQFQSHSIVYGIDLEAPKNLATSPDVLWNLKTPIDQPNAKPSIGVISPTVDVEKVITLIEFEIAQWLESKGIKPGSAGNTGSSSATSAVSKIVDEADTTQVVQANRIILAKAEKQLWALIGLMQNQLSPLPLFLKESRGVSIPWNVSISFPVQQIITDPQELRDQLKFQLENKLISYKRALKTAHPDLSEAEILLLMEEIKQEEQEKAVKTAENASNEPI